MFNVLLTRLFKIYTHTLFMKKNRIVVIGSSNTDMVVYSQHIPKPGETVLGGKFKMNPGGKGANQAVAAARLGGNVMFVASVGSDMFGKESVQNFKSAGIDSSLVTIRENVASGIALILVDEKGENSISVASGANSSITIADIERARPAIKKASFLLIQLEIPLPIVSYAISVATQEQCPVILNPAPALHLSDHILEAVSIITPNETEAEILTGIKVIDTNTAKQAAIALRKKGVQKVIITLGAKGAFILTDEIEVMVPVMPVTPVDTTAAGDTFNGALAVALSEGMDLISSVRFANQAAALSVTKEGAQASIPSRSELTIQPH